MTPPFEYPTFRAPSGSKIKKLLNAQRRPGVISPVFRTVQANSIALYRTILQQNAVNMTTRDKNEEKNQGK